jgi:RNA polymerase sigma factor (sigma-70 family)
LTGKETQGQTPGMSSAPSDREGFDAFYARRRAWLIKALRPIVGSDAEDVAQDSFLALFQRWDVISRYDSPEAWLRRIAIRAAIRRRTRDIARSGLEATSAGRNNGTAHVDLSAPLLVSVLGSLPEADREALVLRHLADRPLGEVAERLGVSEATARVRLLRARRRALEEASGLRGRWVLETTWRRPALAAELRDHGFEHALDTVMDDLEECGRIQTHLRLDGRGRFLMTNREDMHLDHGRFLFDGHRLTLHSDGYPGGVVHEASMDSDVVILRQVENRNPLVKGAPDAAFQFALLGSAPLRWESPEPRSA